MPKNKETALTLRAVAEGVRAWADTLESMEDGDPQREQAMADMAASLTTGEDKVERFGWFLRRCKAEAEMLRAEAERCADKARRVEALEKDLKEYALDVLAENELPRIEGRTLHLRAQRSPNVVLIHDEAKVPSAYKTLTITVPAVDWEEHLEYLAEQQSRELALLKSVIRVKSYVALPALKEALEQGPVPGAELVTDRKHLRVG